MEHRSLVFELPMRDMFPLLTCNGTKTLLTPPMLYDIVREDPKQHFHLVQAPDGSITVKAVAGRSAGTAVTHTLPKLHDLPILLVHETRAIRMPGITRHGLN